MPPREKLPEVDRISHGTPHRLLVLSNGHGEDLIALRVCEALRRLRPELPLAVLPLVGEGGAFAAAPQELALERLGPCLPLPSGGFSNQSVRGLLQDMAAGLPRTTWQQLQVVRRWGAAGQPILAIGDLLPLAMAWLSGGSYGFIGTPKSDYTWRSPSPAGWPPSPLADGYHRCKGSEWDPWEWALMSHRHCRLVAVRDALTARGLRSHHVGALAPGNPMMDGFEAKELPPSLRYDRRVLLLPGSRLPEALGNFKRLLSGLPHPSQCDCLGGVSVLVPISQGLNRSSAVAAVMAEAHFEPVPPPLPSEAEGCWSKGSLRVLFGVGRFASWAPWAEVGLATAGTATEQLVGLGLPALSLPGAGPQFTVGFARRQSRLLGGAVEPCKTAGRMQMRLLELLEDASARRGLGRKGKQRMGPAGGSEALAHLIVDRLLDADPPSSASRAG